MTQPSPDSPNAAHATTPEAAGTGGGHHFVRHAWVVAGLTLLSRSAGLIREMVCARIFGASAIWSAFMTALQVPNVFRRLFGEGALSAAFIPRYARLVRDDEPLSHRFASLVLARLLLWLTLLVAVAEVVLAVLMLATPMGRSGGDVLRFSMLMLPYMPLVCASALVGGMLQVHGRFAAYASAPIWFNAVLIGAALLWSRVPDADLRATATAVAIGVSVSGVLQLAGLVWMVRSKVRWTRDTAPARGHARDMLRTMAPAAIGMGTLQISTLADALIAGWPVIFGPNLAPGVLYPLDEKAASIMGYAQRLYQFPLGVFGLAVATAVFPALSRDAADPSRYAATLRQGLRLSLFIALPAAVGLMLVAGDLCQVVYRGGKFTEADGVRTSAVLLGYAAAVWAYSGTQVLSRAFYALGDTRTPMKVGVTTVLVNVALNMALIWQLKEAGLAWATATTAIGQFVALSVLRARRMRAEHGAALFDRETVRALWGTALCALAMAGLIVAVRALLPVSTPGWWGHALGLLRDVLVGGLAYAGLALGTRRPELKWLVQRRAGAAATAEVRAPIADEK